MHKISVFLFLLLMVSCTSKTHNQSDASSNNIINNEKKVFNLMKNGLIEPLKGNWVNTILLDSTLLNRKIQPYTNSFCCNLLLTIEHTKSVNLQGLIDNGELIIQKKDSISFTLVDDNGSDFGEFKYLVDRDLIVQMDHSKPLFYYKRTQNTIPITIIQDEMKFKNFFVNQLFTDYFSEKEKEQIVYIYSGFETFNPFDFDAIGFRDDRDSTIFYAWIFKGDQLELFNTTFSYDDDSGFAIYKKGKLFKKISKRIP